MPSTSSSSFRKRPTRDLSLRPSSSSSLLLPSSLSLSSPAEPTSASADGEEEEEGEVEGSFEGFPDLVAFSDQDEPSKWTNAHQSEEMSEKEEDSEEEDEEDEEEEDDEEEEEEVDESLRSVALTHPRERSEGRGRNHSPSPSRAKLEAKASRSKSLKQRSTARDPSWRSHDADPRETALAKENRVARTRMFERERKDKRVTGKLFSSAEEEEKAITFTTPLTPLQEEHKERHEAMREPLFEADEYPQQLSDSSEDEGVTGQELRYRNRIGNIPLEWYKEHDHIGYDVQGRALTRKGISRNGNGAINAFLDSLDKNRAHRTVYDAVNDEYIELTADEVRSLQRIRHGSYGHLGFDPDIDYTGQAFTEEIRLERLGNAQAPKARFAPSKHEAKRVVKLIRALRMGWIKTDEQIEEERRKSREDKARPYLLWGDDGQLLGNNKTGLHRMPVNLPAPKEALPGHAHSYNPPLEYLFNAEEKEAWLKADPSDRTLDFIPQRFTSMRAIPAFEGYAKNRFERCLDLYLAPRVRRRKVQIGDPDSLIPQLPNPSELRPFPTQLSHRFKRHTARIRTVCISPTGEWMVSGGEDGLVCLWEVSTGRLFKTFSFNPTNLETNDTYSENSVIIEHVAFNPNPALPVFAVCAGRFVILLRHGFGCSHDELALDISMRTKSDSQREVDEKIRAGTSDSTLVDSDELDEASDFPVGSKRRDIIWRVRREKHGRVERLVIRPRKNYDQDEAAMQVVEEDVDDETAVHLEGSSVSMVIMMPAPVMHTSWHAKGDYFSTAITVSQSVSRVHIHRLSTHSSNNPFSKSNGIVTGTSFHPSQPIFFLSTKINILAYHLIQQKLLKTMAGSIAHISSMHLHPNGDHILVSGYDRKVAWFDLDMGTAPYRTLKYHSRAVRSVHIHKRWPLFASLSDDGTAHIFHATVYDDLLTNPLIVPLKILRCHDIVDGIGGMSCFWHPTQPWLLTSGADGLIKLWV